MYFLKSAAKVVCQIKHGITLTENNATFKDVVWESSNTQVATISEDGVHIHVSFADEEGVTIGGHLSDGCIVNTTCEVCIIEIDNYKMNRVFDEETGYNELVVSEIIK